MIPTLEKWAAVLNKYIGKFWEEQDTREFLLATAIILGRSKTSEWSNLTADRVEGSVGVQGPPTFFKIGSEFVKIVTAKNDGRKLPGLHFFQGRKEKLGSFQQYFKQEYGRSKPKSDKKMKSFAELYSLYILKLYCKCCFTIYFYLVCYVSVNNAINIGAKSGLKTSHSVIQKDLGPYIFENASLNQTKDSIVNNLVVLPARPSLEESFQFGPFEGNQQMIVTRKLQKLV
jgi:hypothetical protein